MGTDHILGVLWFVSAHNNRSIIMHYCRQWINQWVNEWILLLGKNVPYLLFRGFVVRALMCVFEVYDGSASHPGHLLASYELTQDEHYR